MLIHFLGGVQPFDKNNPEQDLNILFESVSEVFSNPDPALPKKPNSDTKLSEELNIIHYLL